MAYASEPQDAVPDVEQTVKTAPPDGYAEYQQFLQWKAMQAEHPIEDAPPPPTPILNPAEHQQDVSVEAGQLQTAIRSGQIDPTMLEKLLKRLDDLEGQVAAQRAAEAQSGGVGPEGGAPVPHHLHLTDGTVITDHPGLATHYAKPDGRIVRVLHAFRADEDVTR
jgi:hypothetical protein